MKALTEIPMYRLNKEAIMQKAEAEENVIAFDSDLRGFA